ncbi:MAG: O-methyltransferase [Clostridia bacterium]|nr:O-methyltransferase [Clostridia bacterium]
MNEDTNNFTYAHNDTSAPERESRTISLNKFNFSDLVQKIRQNAFGRGIPVSSDETLAYLCTCALMAKPQNILEIGTAIGVSGICILEQCTAAHLTTIELNPGFATEAEDNFARAHMSEMATVIRGDAAEVLPTLKGEYDFIFLDGPKVQYVKYLPQMKRLLKKGGTLFADDVLLYGWVNGERETPKKRKMLVEHIREYITAVTNDADLYTVIVDIGNGVALSVKK